MSQNQFHITSHTRRNSRLLTKKQNKQNQCQAKWNFKSLNLCNTFANLSACTAKFGFAIAIFFCGLTKLNFTTPNWILYPQNSTAVLPKSISSTPNLISRSLNSVSLSPKWDSISPSSVLVLPNWFWIPAFWVSLPPI